MKEQESRRLISLDAAKGIGILLVILGHCMRDEMRSENPALDYLYRAIYAFHMPFFFWISGYLYRRNRSVGKNPAEYLLSRLKKWLLPWILYVLFIYVLFFCAMLAPIARETLEAAGNEVMPFLDYLLLTLQAVNPYAQHLWFIYVLFLFSVLFYALDRLTGGKRTDLLCSGFLIASLCADLGRNYVIYEYGYGEWWKLAYYFCTYLPFFALGIFMQSKVFPDHIVQIWGGLGLVYVLIRARWFSGFYGDSIQAASFPGKMAILYLSYALLPGLMMFLCKIFQREGSAAFLAFKKGLAYLGENSFWIYLLHQPFCCGFLGELLYNQLHLPAITVMGCCIVFSLSVPLAGVKMCRYVSIAFPIRISERGAYGDAGIPVRRGRDIEEKTNDKE